MKKFRFIFTILALALVFGLTLASCDTGGGDGNNSTPSGPSGPGSGPAATHWTVNNEAAWIEAVNGIRTGGNDKAHVVTISGNLSVLVTPLFENTFGNVTGITVTLDGNGSLTPSTSGQLLTIGSGQTVTVRNLTLQGRSDNSALGPWLIFVDGGTLIMDGSASVTGTSYTANKIGGGTVGVAGTFIMRGTSSITNNTNSVGGVEIYDGSFIMEDNSRISNNTSIATTMSGGVFLYGGTFTMRGNASVSNNTSIGNSVELTSFSGGGVNVNAGTFIMQGNASVSNNTVSHYGGGVSIGSGGVFTMQSGSISGNTAAAGGGVYVDGTFTMENGTISGNNAIGNTYSSFRAIGGGVFGFSGTFTKTGGTIYGNDAAEGLRNTAAEGNRYGHAVVTLTLLGGGWRDTTAGPQMNTGTYGFWEGQSVGSD